MYIGEYPLITDEFGIPFLISGIGKTDYQCVINRPEGFPKYQILYTWHGKGKISVNGKEYLEVSEGDVFFFSADISHKYEPVSDKWSVSWITFDGNHIDETISRYGLNDGKPVHSSDLHYFERLFDKIVRILRSKERYAIHTCSPLIFDMIVQIYKIKQDQLNGRTQVEAGYIAKVVKYIQENCEKEISLCELAQIGDVSKEHLCKIFKKQMNMRPFEYIARCRIQKAKQLLVNTNLPISEIGEKVGYHDKSYFGYVFKQYENMSPSEFRGN